MQAPPTDHPPDAPTGLTVDDDAAPLAVAGAPEFGWIVHDADRNERQRAYELIVSDAPTRGKHTVLFDSGTTTSSRQSYVLAPGLRLAPDHTYWWTVRTQDASGRFGPYAVDARFDTALADGDWHASWIRRAGALPRVVDIAGAPFGPDDFSLLRKETSVAASPIVRARVYAAAGQQYELHVNGTRAAHGPSFSYPDEQYYETTDVTSLVRAGAPNVFAFVTHWSTGGQGRPDSPEAFIAHITVDHADGTRQVVTTDGTWRTHSGPWIPGAPRNDEGDLVEHVDERLVPVGWDRAGFDDRAWPAAVVLGPHPWPPFTHLVPVRTHIVETPMRPQTLKRLADGAYVVDFGAVTAATPVVEIRHGGAGRKVKLVSGDLLDPNGHVSTTVGHQQTDMHWDFDERSGAQELRPFGYLGFRYLEVDGASEPLTSSDITIAARHASMPDETAATFRTSDPRVDAVWNLARHSALYDTQEQFLDTPTREKGQFLGDSYDVSQATMAGFGERSMTFEALRDFARSQVKYWPDGRVNAVYPNSDQGRDIPDFTQDYVEWVWKVWTATGDRDLLATLYPVVHDITDYVARAIDPRTGLVTNLPGGGGDYQGGLIDWPIQMRYGYDMNTVARTTVNVLAVDDFRRVAAMAAVLDKPAGERRTQTARADALTAAMRKRLERPDGVFVDGLRADGTRSTHVSQQANAYALAFGIVPPRSAQHVADTVIGLKTAMGVVNYHVLLEALHDTGHDDAIVTALTDADRPGYARILSEGATFTWESWDARQTGDSESHGWGSTVLAVLQDDILGVRVTQPGAARVEVAVPTTSLTNATGVVATQRGPIPIAWTRDATGHETIDVTIPANVGATLSITGTGVAGISEGGRSVVGDLGVTSPRAAGGNVVMTVGSGHYVFSSSPPSEAGTGSSSSSSATTIVVVVVPIVLVLIAAAVAVGRRRRQHGSVPPR
jgi:alpha-L-rhamnosidase